jgi:uncharacterized protein (TIGR00369 family)
MRQPVMGIAEMHDFLDAVFPQMRGRFRVLAIEPFRLSVEMNVTEADIRPGGTVSGPTLFTLADCAFYMATLAMIGPEALTVTTGAAIDFMRKPAPGVLTAEARVLKLGRTLAVGDVMIWSEGMAEPVAHANLTYSIPPKR